MFYFKAFPSPAPQKGLGRISMRSQPKAYAIFQHRKEAEFKMPACAFSLLNQWPPIMYPALMDKFTG